MKTRMICLFAFAVVFANVAVLAEDVKETITKLENERKAKIEQWDFTFGGREHGQRLSHWSSDFLFGLKQPDPDDDPFGEKPKRNDPVDEKLCGELAGIVKALQTAALQNRTDDFYIHCLSDGKAAAELYKSFRERVLCWDHRCVFFARHRKDANLIAVHVLNKHSLERDIYEILALEKRQKQYLEATGRDRAFLIEDVRFGFQHVFYFRYVRDKKKWLIDPKFNDRNLESVLRDELFYIGVRTEIWHRTRILRAKLQYKDLGGLKDPGTFYLKNRHFTAKEAIAKEKLVYELRRRRKRPGKEKGPWSSAQRSAMADWKRNPDTIEWVKKCLETDEWKKHLTEKELARRLKIVNDLNHKEIEMMAVSGKDRVLRLVGDCGVKIFRKPISVDISKYDDPAKYRDDVLRLVSTEQACSYWGRLTKDDRKRANELYVKAGLKPRTTWSRKQERKLSSIQIQGYQQMSFEGARHISFVGVQVNPEAPLDCRPMPLNAFGAVKGARGNWFSDQMKAQSPYAADVVLVSAMFRSAFDYELVTNSRFNHDLKLGKRRYLEYEFTGKEFNDRLKEEKLYDILRIRKSDECIPYKKGMDFRQLPVFTVDEIKKSK